MNPKAVQRVFGLLIMAFSLTMLPPVAVSLWYQDLQGHYFLYTFFAAFLGGLLAWYPVRTHTAELGGRDGFLIVAMFWLVLGLLSSLPLHFSPHLSYTDAVFESMSAFTTTGATVIVGLDRLPPSVLYYRQQLQWLGGMGIVVLAIAIFPLLGVGGMQLYRAEMPGSSIKIDKLTPRIADTARRLWFVYVAATVLCGLCYWLAGMAPFDAIGHAFSTLSTGGFSTHDASLAYFADPAVEWIASAFMLFAGINFSVHFLALRRRSFKPYLKDEETRTFVGTIAFTAVLVASGLAVAGEYPEPTQGLRDAVFQTVSIVTSTGYTTAQFSEWPFYLPLMLILMSFMGGCAGSTAGGMKVVRMLLLVKQGRREIFRLIHPSAILPVKLGRRALSEGVMSSVWGFFAVYIASFSVIMLMVTATGVDELTAFSAVAACMNNLGPGLGEVSLHYGGIPDVAKWLLAFSMMLGRLEVFTVLVLLTPGFWRR